MIPGKREYLGNSSPARARGLLAKLHLDLPLLLGLVMLCGLGLFFLYSASGENMGMVIRQSIRFAVGFAALVVLAQVSPTELRRWTPWVFVVALLLLLLVPITGIAGKGAQRWLSLGAFRFQPSEIAKIVVPMMVAWYLAEKSLPPKWYRLAVAGMLIILPVVLIAIQPDLGTALLVTTAGGFTLLLAGLSWIFVGGVLLAAIPAGWAYWHWWMLEYQRQRVLTFLDPERDPLGSGYHIIQSKIAIGSGGLYGKGWLNGTQSQLEFLPERTTDFIFAVISEEFGFSGVMLLLALYLFIILRCLYIASQGQDTFSRLVAGSLTLVFFLYLFVNTGMVSGLLPVVGVPLPLISYGGTSLVTILASFGILMSIHTHRRLLSA
jgi:rod shape determining protein RodA